jgi:hypothetical protein
MGKIDNPVVFITGNPVDGFRFHGPWPEDDPNEALYSRGLVQEADGKEWWTAPLGNLLDLEPVHPDDLDGRPADVTKRVLAFGVTDSDLDDLVHDVASALASDANNGGVAGQVAFLLGHLSPDEVLAEAKKIGGRPDVVVVQPSAEQLAYATDLAARLAAVQGGGEVAHYATDDQCATLCGIDLVTGEAGSVLIADDRERATCSVCIAACKANP